MPGFLVFLIALPLCLAERNHVVVDLSGTKLVDHSVMEKLHAMELDFAQENLHFDVIGLEGRRQFSDHPHAARKKGGGSMRRITIVADEELESTLAEQALALGAASCTSMSCREGREPKVRLEIVATPSAADRLLGLLRREVLNRRQIAACIEQVDALPLAGGGQLNGQAVDPATRRPNRKCNRCTDAKAGWPPGPQPKSGKRSLPRLANPPRH